LVLCHEPIADFRNRRTPAQRPVKTLKTVDDRRKWVLACGARNWGGRADLVDALPMPRLSMYNGAPGRLVRVTLPAWAADVGVSGRLLAFVDCMRDGEGPEWMRCDWLNVAWHMLSGSHERAHEERHGPILSYAYRLPTELQPHFDRAWVNRIFMFLRRWAAGLKERSEEQLFGPMPRASIVLTHDVDAVSLTPEIRLKQTAFQLANAARSLLRNRGSAGARLADAGRFALSSGDFHTLARVREMEREAGVRSILHFYGGPPGIRRASPRRMLIDPAYDISSPYMRSELRAFADGGWTIGLHQSFAAWETAGSMRAERERVEQAADAVVTHCRQHWLHFAWGKTWRAQQEAGLTSDSTLGFNDRPGFRSGHALRIHPWDFVADKSMHLEVTPMVFMDSHFFDYGQFDHAAVGAAMKRWLSEVRAVGGEATVNWHPHTITGVYRWGEGFKDLLEQLSAAG
jgi:hypothetical protein